MKLIRDPSTPQGTTGSLYSDDGTLLCYTMERPWLDNAPDVSCIPTGTYPVIRHNSPSHPQTWEITNVPNRAGILIHNGNVDFQSEGCILVGDSIGELNGEVAVLNSVATLAMLNTVLPDTFTLTIQ